MLSIKSLRVDYDQITAVQELTLELKPKEIFALVGPNGAGKTSTIKAIAGILEPTYGEISINGFDTQLQRSDALKHLGYMPDFSPVYENLKVWEYMDVFGAAYLMSKQARCSGTDFWLNEMGLTEKREEFIRNLSRGMRQRLVLAKTLLSEPDVLILDEPASGMDPLARMELRRVLKSFADKGKVVVISSHVLTELDEFCTSVGIMEKGRMVVSGTIAEIRKRLNSNTKIIMSLASLGKEEALISSLKSYGFPSVIYSNQEFIIDYSGNDQQSAELLKNLINEGFDIKEFRWQEENIEDIFFKIGAKETS